MATIPLFIAIGVVGGVLAIPFNRGLIGVADTLSQWRSARPGLVALGIGMVVAMAFGISPMLLGGGHQLTELSIHGQVGASSIALYFSIRLALVFASYGTGAPGGIFAPLLSLGALMGAGMFILGNLIFGHQVTVSACAVAGMCAYFSGVVRAPLTGIILIAEMTGSYDMLLPLLASAFTAYAIAEGLGDTPIYETLPQRDALKNDWDLNEGDLLTAEFAIQPGSRFANRQVRDLGLQPGTLIIFCRHAGREYIPKSDTHLTDGMRVVVASNSPAGIQEVEDGSMAA